MPLTSPVLDDLDYATLEEMLRQRIPLVAPEYWTDHNDSDPGIALIQLFAYLAENVGYRLNRVPEKSYVEFLKLVGIRLAPAVAARTRMAFSLTKPAETEALLIPAFTPIRAKAGDPPPTFGTDADLDVLPAQIAALITTSGGLLDINAPGETGPSAIGADAQAYVAERFSIVWDGKSPKLKDMPSDPVRIFSAVPEARHTTLYVGLAFNRAPSAGFKSARASLHLQLDQDEEPETDDSVMAGAEPLSIVNAFPGGAPAIGYAWYLPPEPGEAAGSWVPLKLISDETQGWTRSGMLRFDVPRRIGPVPDGSWADVEADMPHPLVGALKTPVAGTPSEVPISGWLAISFAVPPMVAIRSLSFNTVEASHLALVRNERLGRGTGLPGQTMALVNQNIDAATLDLVSVDETREDAVTALRQVPDFDGIAEGEPVYALDAEAGVVIFPGPGGRPPVVTERIVARCYRHGGGVSGDVATGAVSLPSGLPPAVGAAFNILPARGGRAAETLDAAKLRAPKAFRMRGRAVSAEDFVDAALAASGVKIARAAVVPLRRPYPLGHLIGGRLAPGVDVTTSVPGALTIIVVPDAPGPYPMPTTSELTAVARHLDTLRLVTTEVHVTTPQYVRLSAFELTVKAAPGVPRTVLSAAIADHLERTIHVLTGGPEGRGFAIGGDLHHADLVAQVMAVPGVARVEGLSCLVDGRTPDDAERPLQWRLERQSAQRLTNCIREATDTDVIALLPDEVPFIDPLSLNVTVVGAP